MSEGERSGRLGLAEVHVSHGKLANSKAPVVLEKEAYWLHHVYYRKLHPWLGCGMPCAQTCSTQVFWRARRASFETPFHVTRFATSILYRSCRNLTTRWVL